MRWTIAFFALAAAPLAAQPVIPTTVDPVAVDFATKTGGTMVYFGINSATIGAPPRESLAAKAQWLLMNPGVSLRIEGHGDGGDTRDHALAMGARRAAAVRDQLVLLGVSPAQLTTTSWGNEKPGTGRVEMKVAR